MTECICLSLDKTDFDYVLHAAERKILNDKIAFISSIPEFSPLPRSKLKNLCTNLITIQCIKNTVVFRENELKQFIYFVRTGEF